MTSDRKLKILLFGKMDDKNKRGRHCGVLRSKFAGIEPLSTVPKQPAEDGEAGVGRQRALSP